LSEIVHKPHSGGQEDFLCSPAQEVFFGGEAGGGKSYALCHDFLYDVDNPNANGILFRKSFPDLEDLIFKAKEHFAGFSPKYNESKHLFNFPSGARFRFAHMGHTSSIFTHAGQEYTNINWDELCHFPRLPYTYLFSRLRSTDPTIFTRVRSTGNPDGIGVLWVKARFIDKLKPYEIGWFKSINDRDVRATPEQEEKLFYMANLPFKDKQEFLLEHPDLAGFISRQWIPTRRKENIALMANNPGYESMLDQLPEKQKRAYKYGVWDTYDAEFQVIKTAWWVRAMSGEVNAQDGIAAVGGDYAESGDKCTMVSGRGNQVKRVKEFDGMKTGEFAKILWKEHHRYGRNQCLTGIDAVGPGVGVFHDLNDLGLGGRCEPCKYKDDTFDEKFSKNALKLKFNNWRTQAWWQFRVDMEAGNIDLHLLETQQYYYDNLHVLQEEVFAHTYEIQNGVVKIISKNDLRKEDSLGRSPDIADALVIWNWMRHRSASHIKPKIDQKVDYGVYRWVYKTTDRTEAVSWT
jgi:hypothetical protein